MNKKILFLVIVSLVLIVGCNNLQDPNNEDSVSSTSDSIRSGTQGLDMSFSPNLPPSQLFDTSELVASLEVRNRGVNDLERGDCIIEFSGFDSNIIRGGDKRQLCNDLPGKKVTNPEGGFNTIEFKSSSISLPRDVNEYNPNIVANACYEYKTVASPQVCIDSNLLELGSGSKACDVRDISLSGQGAPVAVTNVDVKMVGTKAIFQIGVSNKGSGDVVSPQSSIQRCPTGLDYNDYDEVKYSVDLSGGDLIDCTPKDSMVRLENGRGLITCSFEVGKKQAYETPLRIELDYNYQQSIRRQLKIIKTPS